MQCLLPSCTYISPCSLLLAVLLITLLVHSMFCSGIENAKSEKEKQLKETEQVVCLCISRLNALTVPHYYNCTRFLFVPTTVVHVYVRMYIRMHKHTYIRACAHTYVGF